MCGIAGIISADPGQVNERVLLRMAASMAHRGPNGESTWINPGQITGFAHRRLSVIDLSNAASQPMHFRQRYTIIYNGELYNYKEIREQLSSKGVVFNTASDTEVLVAAYATYGVDCLQLFDGMFAFAIWDELEQKLFCARDRFGEKPFYYFLDPETKGFYFASELKAFRAAGIERVINHALFLSYLVHGFTNDPVRRSATFDAQINKIPAAHYLVYRPFQNPQIIRYWDIVPSRANIGFPAAVEKLRELLTVSVKRRLRSDVSLGMSLSGGLDSSGIASLISDTGKHALQTFTAVFPGFDKDESKNSTMIANFFNFEQHCVSPNAGDLVNDIERVLYYQEEPFSSASVFAQYKVYQEAAKNEITVLLDGQGADETLAGYDKYRHWKLKSALPNITAGLLKRQSKWKLDHNQYISRDYLNEHAKEVGILKPVVKTLDDLLYHDVFVQGLEELLRYADRNSMAHGREVRLPYLSHELVSFLFTLPPSFKIGHGYTKFILREMLKYDLPGEVVYRKLKIGFEPPQLHWMAHPTVKEMINASKLILVKKGMLDKRVLKRPVHPHNAYDRKGLDWRWLIAGMWLQH